ncbi:MAG: CopG family transcriptional regulator [Betaproteobacteria bacterium]
MGQVTIYLESDIEKKARTAARSEGVSLSKWVAGRIAHGTRSEWPDQFRKLAGAWPDAPTVEEIRAKYGKDVKRSRL